MPLLDLVRDYLIASGAVSGGWVCYQSRMPDDQDKVISVFETGGYPPTEINRDTENVSFQLRVRGPAFSYALTRAKWYECKTLLKDSQQTTGSPVLLAGIVFIQVMNDGPMHFVDPKNRDNFTTNFRVKKYPDS